MIATLVTFWIATTPAAADNAPAGGERRWWSPGEGTPLAAFTPYPNSLGLFGLVNVDGPVVTAGHPFFEPIGSNGRACVTCHQPADAMSLSVDSIRQRWQETEGKDPLFASIDGSNCPHLPAGDPASHSLLLDRGLIRIFLPWPPRTPEGQTIDPEFEIEVVRDPTACNTHPEYGLSSAAPHISVYRRPRPAINLRYVVANSFIATPFVGKSGLLAPRDPKTGKPLNLNMMADAREPTLASQAQSAARDHLQLAGDLTSLQLESIEAFERQLYGAQSFS
ncbi:MAG TPA: hypothetical protein VFG52_05935, partial [Xanthomonadales bacterium]|nr:hypothetical protein [Xanthomonadales bacterium]